MKSKKIISFVFGTLCLCTFMTSCQENIPQEQKDWENITAYFNATDEAGTTTYYIPSAGSAGDPLPFYDPEEKED